MARCFNGGSVAIHIFDSAFIARAGSTTSDVQLPFHRADKKIPYVGADGVIVTPDAANGVKFEMFVFDALPLAKNPVIIEAARPANIKYTVNKNVLLCNAENFAIKVQARTQLKASHLFLLQGC